MRRRIPALGLVLGLLCALTLVVADPSTAAARTSVSHFGKKVVLTCFDQHGPSPRLDQPVATEPHVPDQVGRGPLSGDDATPADPLTPVVSSPATRGPPAGR